ncbi:hypothetical protein PEC18_05580 [Paucibacter sp. O1-1]|nr:hypothetical protein [Paucibacter sp. O1-1]MDA3825341.1 hypothetical protein [Paucibacter sp. O1-1]
MDSYLVGGRPRQAQRCQCEASVLPSAVVRATGIAFPPLYLNAEMNGRQDEPGNQALLGTRGQVAAFMSLVPVAALVAPHGGTRHHFVAESLILIDPPIPHTPVFQSGNPYRS